MQPKIHKSHAREMRSAQAEQLKDFVNLTGCSEEQAIILLTKGVWNMHTAIKIFNEEGILPQPEILRKSQDVEEFVRKWSGRDPRFQENIGEDGLEQFFRMLGVSLDNPVVGFIMIVCMGMKQAGEATKTNIYNLLQYTHSSSLTELTYKLESLQQLFFSRSDLFKLTYDELFDFYSVSRAPTMDFDIGEQLWTIYLRNIMKFHPYFVSFLKQIKNRPSKIHRDLWRMLYEFSVTIHDIEEYKEEDAWPVFIDEFVDFVKNCC